MKFLYHSMEELRLDNLETHLFVKTDGNLLYVILRPAQTSGVDYGVGLTASVTYNGHMKSVSSDPYREMTVTFPYADDVKTVRLTAGAVKYDGESMGTSMAFTWKGSLTDPDPVVNFRCNGIREDYYEVFEWSGTAEGCVCGLTLVFERVYQYVYNAWNNGMQKISTPVWESPWSRSTNIALQEGEQLYYVAYVGAYRSTEDSRDDYVGLTEVITPVHTVAGRTIPFTPYLLEYGSPVLGARLKVTWNEVVDDKYEIGLYELERSVDGGDYTLVYAGASTTFTDTLGSGWSTVCYRVRCKGYSYSLWKTGETKTPCRSNLYVGVGGVPTLASGMYVGRGGIRQAEPMIRMG